jgi:uncharacterized RDD family membrane protein YckC
MTRTSRTTAKVTAVSGTERGMSPLHPTAQGWVAAGRARRMAAHALDLLVFLPFFFVGAVMGGGVFFVTLLYFAFYNSVRGAGRSLGRAAVGQRLMMDDGQEASHGVMIARNLLRSVLWMMFLPFFVDLALMLFGDGRLLADRIFRTRVVEDPETVRAQATLRDARREASVTGRVEAEAERWDDRFEQSELDEIAEGLQFGAKGSNRDLDDFERRLTASMSALDKEDPALARFDRALAGESLDSLPTRSTVFDFAQEAEVEQEVKATHR